MIYVRATRFLVNNAYRKFKRVVGEKPEPEQRLLLSMIKQALVDGYIWSPPTDMASARRFLMGDGFAKCCLNLSIDPDYGQRVMAELTGRLDDDAAMQALDNGLLKITKQRKLEIDD